MEKQITIDKKDESPSSFKLDLHEMIGTNILIESEKFTDQKLTTRVLGVVDDGLAIDHTLRYELVDQLVTDDSVFVEFNYKNQRVSTSATIKRTHNGGCNIYLDSEITPLYFRKFTRFRTSKNVALAVLPHDFSQKQISRLRWMHTRSLNFSSGGVMLNLPSMLSEKSYLLMNIEAPEFDFPQLVVGNVRYCEIKDTNENLTGIKFIVADRRNNHFSSLTLKNLPANAFELNQAKQIILEKLMKNKIPEKEEK